MASLRLDADNDIDFSTGTAVWIGGARAPDTRLDAIAQHVRTRLQLFQGEWFLDDRVGVPWFQRILGRKGVRDVASQILRSVVAGTPGIVKVDRFDLSIDSDRHAEVSFSATADTGETIDLTVPLIVG